jgi:hypothetical protein
LSRIWNWPRLSPATSLKPPDPSSRSIPKPSFGATNYSRATPINPSFS